MVKVISLSEKAYHDLKGLKDSGESFSDVVLKLVEKEVSGSILDFSGIWKGYHELDGIFSGIKKDRKKFRTRDVLVS